MNLESYRKLGEVVLPDNKELFSQPESKEFFEKVLEQIDQTEPSEEWLERHNYSLLKLITTSQLRYLAQYGKTFWET